MTSDPLSGASPDALAHFGLDPSRSKMKRSPIASMVKVPPGTSKQTFRKVVAGAQMAYMMHKQAGKGKTLPTVEEISRLSGVTNSAVNRVLATEEFRMAMRERGIYWTVRDSLAPEQAYAIGILTNPADKRDMEKKLAAAGITYAIYRNWLRQPLFAAAIKQVGEDLLRDHISDVHTALTSKAVGGDIRAMELYYQISGRFDPAREQQHDINRLVTLLLEVLFRNVTDMKVLERINNEFNMVLSGETPVPSLPEAAIVESEVEEAPDIRREPASVEFNLPEGIDLHEGDPNGTASDDDSGASSGGDSGFLIETPPVGDDGELPPGFFEFYEEN